jgi:hypothetical protein
MQKKIYASILSIMPTLVAQRYSANAEKDDLEAVSVCGVKDQTSC